jgi:HlyD family secretion protein
MSARPSASSSVMRRWWPPALFVLVAIAGGVGLWHQLRLQQQLEAQRQQQPLPRRIAALGRVEPLDRVVQLSVPASLSSDAIRNLNAKEGDTVQKGQVLAVLESQQSLERTVDQSTAAVKVAQRKLTAQNSVIARSQAELAQAVVELRRYTMLYAQGATSAEVRDRRITIEKVIRADLEQALQDRDTLRAEVIEKQQILQRDRAERDKALIKAPFSGTVFKINAYPGDKVGDEGILEIGDSSRMGVIAEVYQSDRPGISLGQRAVITADGFPGRQLEGRVVEISRQVSRQSIYSGEAGENLDRRVIEVKIGLGPEAAAIASTINYMQVNVVFDPLTAQEKQQQQQRLQQLIEQQRREQPGLSQPTER